MLNKNYCTYQVKPALPASTASTIALPWRIGTPMADIAYHFERMLTLACLLYNAYKLSSSLEINVWIYFSVVTAYQEIETYPGKEASAIAVPRSFLKNRIHRLVV